MKMDHGVGKRCCLIFGLVVCMCLWPCTQGYDLVVTRYTSKPDSFVVFYETSSGEAKKCDDFEAKAIGKATVQRRITSFRCECYSSQSLLTTNNKRTKCVGTFQLLGETGCYLFSKSFSLIHTYPITRSNPPRIIATVRTLNTHFRSCLSSNDYDLLVEKVFIWNGTVWSASERARNEDFQMDSDDNSLEWMPSKLDIAEQRWLTYGGLLLKISISCKYVINQAIPMNVEGCFLLKFNGSKSYPLEPPKHSAPTLSSIEVASTSISPSSSLASSSSPSTALSLKSSPSSSSSSDISFTSSITTSFITSTLTSSSVWTTSLFMTPSSILSMTTHSVLPLPAVTVSLPSSLIYTPLLSFIPSQIISVPHSSKALLFSGLSPSLTETVAVIASSPALQSNETSPLPTSSDSNGKVTLAIVLSCVLLVALFAIGIFLFRSTAKRRHKESSRALSQNGHVGGKLPEYAEPTPAGNDAVPSRGRFNRGFLMASLPYYENPIEGQTGEAEYATPDRESYYMGLSPHRSSERDGRYQTLSAATLSRTEQNTEPIYHVLDEKRKSAKGDHDYNVAERET